MSKIDNKSVLEFVNKVASEERIEKNIVFDAMLDAIREKEKSCYSQNSGVHIRADGNMRTGNIKLRRLLKVVDRVSNHDSEINLSNARRYKKRVKLGERVEEPLDSATSWDSDMKDSVIEKVDEVKQRREEAENFIKLADKAACEHGIDRKFVFGAMADAFEELVGEHIASGMDVRVDINEEASEINLHQLLKVVEKISDSGTEISLPDARCYKKGVKIGDCIERRLDWDEDWNVRHAIIGKINEVRQEREEGERVLRLVDEIADEENVEEKDKDIVFDATAAAIAEKERSDYNSNVRLHANIDKKTGKIDLHRLWEIVDEVSDDDTQITVSDIRYEEKEGVRTGSHFEERLEPGRPWYMKDAIIEKVRKLKGEREELERVRQFPDKIARKEGINKKIVFNAMVSAIEEEARSRYKDDPGMSIDIKISEETGEISLRRFWKVVKEVSDSATQISLSDAHNHNKGAKIGSQIGKHLDLPRLRDVEGAVLQKVREVKHEREQARRQREYEKYKGCIDEAVNVKVTDIDSSEKHIYVSFGRNEAAIRRKQLLPGEKYKVGDCFRAYIHDVRRQEVGPQIYLVTYLGDSLSELLRRRIPEISDEVIEIRSVAWERGSRSKVAVMSNDSAIDPVSRCIGLRGSHVKYAIDNLNVKKIDFIYWSDQPDVLAKNALWPARPINATVNEKKRQIDVCVPNGQLSVALGHYGQNVRLASILVGWEIDVFSESDFAARQLITMTKEKKKK